ncbi:MAG: PAS domain S-box protein [Bacillota bacterium]
MTNFIIAALLLTTIVAVIKFKKFKQKFEQQKKEQDILLDNLEYQVWYLEDEKTYGTVNQAHADFLGVSKEELAYRSFDVIYPAEQVEEYIKTSQEVFARKEEVQVQEWLKNSAGEERLLEITKTPKLDDTGEIEYITCTARDITEQVRNRQLLKEQEEKFKTIFAEDKTIKLIIDPSNGQIIDANQAAQDFYGYSYQELTTKEIQEINQLDQNEVKAEMKRAKKKEKDFFNFQHQIATGEIRNVEVYSNPITVHGSELLISSIHDITERIESQHKLQKSEEKFRQLAENIEEVFWLRTEEEMIYISPAFEEVWGRSCEELYQNPNLFLNTVHPQDLDEVMEEFENNRKNFNLEYRIIQPNGEVRWVWARSFVIAEGGQQYRRAGIAEDITERKKIEEDLRKTKELYNNVINTQQEMICRFKPDTTLTFVNQAYCDYFEQNREDLIGSKYLKLIPEEEHEAVLKKLDEVAAGREPVTYEYQAKSSDGSLTWQQWTDYPIFSDDEQLVAFQSIGIDITARKKREKELKQAKLEAEAANQAKSEFLANMSHEIRTPLNAVIGFSDLLADMFNDNAEQQRYAASIKKAGENLLTLINDILDLSKIEAGKLKMDYQFFDAAELVREIKDIFALKLQEKDLVCKLNIQQGLPVIKLDKTRLRQILLNLVGNAVKFTTAGYLKIKLDFEKTEEKELDLYLELEDTGVGIAKEAQEKVFSSFQQQDNSATKQQQGTGLGLAITKRLTEMMGGEISLESEMNEGSTFKLKFDNVEWQAQQYSQQQKSTIAEEELSFAPAKILIVDDVASNREVLEKMLKVTSIEIKTAVNGTQAVELAQKEKFDLILMDLKMPQLDGYQSLETIKAQQLNHNTPIIAVTAFATNEEEDKVQQAGFAAFITKPIQKNKLFKLLQKYLDCENENKAVKNSLKEENLELELEQEQLLELIVELEQKFRPWAQDLQETVIINEIENFVEELIALAQNYEVSFLSDYAKGLQEDAFNFEMDQIKEKLSKFAGEIEKLKK